MTEIEKMRKYIERTKIPIANTSGYNMATLEAFALIEDGGTPFESVVLAFKYGQAKGYRAAKAEVKRA